LPQNTGIGIEKNYRAENAKPNGAGFDAKKILRVNISNPIFCKGYNNDRIKNQF
jgi:hypothetical protein